LKEETSLMSQITTQELYSHYVETMQKVADFNNAAAVLSWDQEVYMPKKGHTFRGRQLATLAAHAHHLATSDSFGKLLKNLSDKADLSEVESLNVRLSLEDYVKNKKLTSDFVEKLTQQTSASYNAWIEAREKNDYSIYAPELEMMIEFKKQQAEMYGYTDHPYDALLDDYEKGASVAMLDPIFKLVKEQLPPVLKRITESKQVNDSFFYSHYPRQKQWDFSIEILKAMGYDFEAGRQDFAEHPFSISFAPSDVRVTTRVSENNFTSLLWSSIHEGGHALYEQGLPEAQYGLPLGSSVSLSIHESQSRLWENCVGRGVSLWNSFYPKLQQYFLEQLGGVDLQDFYKAVNKVEPSLIRTEADELTYHFHVMIRYEIEKGLLAGDINPKDLSSVWNDYYQKYLGISSDNEKEGVLQDVHWSHGSFGYFPTYSLGSFYAAQFFEQAEKDMPGLSSNITQGNLHSLLLWLREKVHQHGRRYTSEELCMQITGRGLDFSSFIRYLEKKYSAIYSVPIKNVV
jgi:carboxypeptidase Taq